MGYGTRARNAFSNKGGGLVGMLAVFQELWLTILVCFFLVFGVGYAALQLNLKDAQATNSQLRNPDNFKTDKDVTELLQEQKNNLSQSATQQVDKSLNELSKVLGDNIRTGFQKSIDEVSDNFRGKFLAQKQKYDLMLSASNVEKEALRQEIKRNTVVNDTNNSNLKKLSKKYQDSVLSEEKLRKLIESLNLSVTTSQATVTSNAKTIESLTSQKKLDTKMISSQSLQVASLSKDLKGMRSDVSKLGTQVKDLEKRLKDSKKLVASRDSTIVQLQSDINRVNQSLSVKDGTIKDLSGQNSSLQKSLTENKMSVSKLEDKDQSNQTVITELNADVATLRSDLLGKDDFYGKKINAVEIECDESVATRDQKIQDNSQLLAKISTDLEKTESQLENTQKKEKLLTSEVTPLRKKQAKMQQLQDTINSSLKENGYPTRMDSDGIMDIPGQDVMYEYGDSVVREAEEQKVIKFFSLISDVLQKDEVYDGIASIEIECSSSNSYQRKVVDAFDTSSGSKDAWEFNMELSRDRCASYYDIIEHKVRYPNKVRFLSLVAPKAVGYTHAELLPQAKVGDKVRCEVNVECDKLQRAKLKFILVNQE